MEQAGNIQLEYINRQLRELAGLYRGAVSASGMSENEFWIWYTLITSDKVCAQQDICAYWSLSKQTVNTIVTNLVRQGYATLEVIPGTRNRKAIRLTPAGRRYGQQFVLPVSQAEQRTLARLPEGALAACSAALGNYIRIFKEEIYGNEESTRL